MTALPTPAVLLLDFGGVVVETSRRPAWAEELAAELRAALDGAGAAGRDLTAEHIADDLRAAAAADSHWKDAMSRPAAPAEMTPRRYWGEFVASDWPDAARAWVTAHAVPLCHRLGVLRQNRTTRPGIPELLTTAAHAGIRTGIVSNALSGAVHRDHLHATGLDRAFAAQIYSDETGIRKPNPEILRTAARALGTPPSECWYVGDNFDRDVLCARRAGVGAAILMEAHGTYHRPYPVRAEPDAVVADPTALHDLLRDVLGGATTGGPGAPPPGVRPAVPSGASPRRESA